MESDSPASTRPFPEVLAVCFTLLLAFITYARTIRFGFVYDDIAQIVENRFLRSPRDIKLFFSAQVWAFNFHNVPGGYYRPFFLLWLLLNHMAFGVHASLWHLTNILLHLAVTGMAYVAVKELVGDAATAWIVSLIFGLHPIHVESVAWVSGCTDPLAAFWTFAAFWSFMKWRKRSAAGWLALSLASYAGAMLSKETALILPIILLAYEWLWDDIETEPSWIRRWLARLTVWFRRLWGYAALTVAYLAARWHALGGIARRTNSLSVADILWTWPRILLLSAEHLVWPFGLREFYGHLVVYTPGMISFALPVAMVAVIVAALVSWIRRTGRTSPREAKLIAFGCVWLIAPLAPLADLAALPMTSDIYHDRYLYMSVLGLGLLVALALRRLKRGAVAFGLPSLQIAAVCGMATVLGLASSVQGNFWRNSYLLFSRGVTGTPSLATVANLATSLSVRGDYAKAITLYQKALEGRENDWSYIATKLRINLASTLALAGRNDQAIGLYQYVLEHEPNKWSAIYNLGLTEYRVGNLQAALKYLRLAIANDQHHGGEYFYLGLTDLRLQRTRDAAKNFARAIAIHPHGFAYHLALGQVDNIEGKRKEAIGQFKEELASYPKETAARQLLEAAEHAEQKRNVAQEGNQKSK